MRLFYVIVDAFVSLRSSLRSSYLRDRPARAGVGPDADPEARRTARRRGGPRPVFAKTVNSEGTVSEL